MYLLSIEGMVLRVCMYLLSIEIFSVLRVCMYLLSIEGMYVSSQYIDGIYVLRVCMYLLSIEGMYQY